MAESQRNNRGVCFHRSERENLNSPPYTGEATIDGVNYFMDIWVNTSNKGTKYLSASFKRKDKQTFTQEQITEEEDIPL